MQRDLLTSPWKWIAVRLKVIANKAGLKRQISTITEKLRNPSTEPFHKVFINQRPTANQTSDISTFSDLSEAEVQKKKATVLYLRRASLNAEQIEAFILHKKA